MPRRGAAHTPVRLVPSSSPWGSDGDGGDDDEAEASGKPLLPAAPALGSPTRSLGDDAGGTLRAALASASAGEEHVLADGKYMGDDGTNYVLDVHKDIVIRAQNAGLAILSGEHARMVVFIRNGSVVLDGLVLTQGSVSKNFSGDYLSTLPC